MRELILSDITEMGPGLCVIGVERATQDAFRSVRPVPPRGNAWPNTFPHRRGSIVGFDPAPTPASLPHIEDQCTHGLSSRGRSLTEIALLDLLHHAETSADLDGLFECELHTDTPGGNAWVPPDSAMKSICGCQYTNVRFRVFEDPGRTTLRARLVLPSGETLDSLPVVDWEWRNLVRGLEREPLGPSGSSYIETRLNRRIRAQLMKASYRFARIGLARPSGEKCWLMLDSLFPQPSTSWLTDP
jgi:hypothetical protein